MAKWQYWILLLALCCGLSSLSAKAGDVKAQGPDANSPITVSYFGMVIHGTGWPPFPIGSSRVQVAWSLVERERGVSDFEQVDKAADRATQQHAELLFGMGLSPSWASSHPDGACKTGKGACWEPQKIDDWRNYVKAVGTRYNGKVHYYQVWNEPNQGMFYQGTVPSLVSLTQAASQVLKGIDPEGKIVSPAPIGPKGLVWMDQFLQKGGGKYIDIVGFHMYSAPAAPESIVGQMKQLHAIMARNGIGDMPVWDTENTWTGQPVDEQTKVGYLARIVILDRLAGASRLFWYLWGDPSPSQRITLVQADGKTLTAAGKAYGVLQDWLIGAVLRGCATDDIPKPWQSSHSKWDCNLQRGDVLTKIVWNPDGDTTYQVPLGWQLTRIRYLSGESSSIPKNGRITIGLQPVLLDRAQ